MSIHEYQRSPHSGAGNCACGMAEESRSHPHTYTQARRSNRCVCAHPADHPIHTDANTARPDPVYPEPAASGLRGTEAARDAVRQARGDAAAPQRPILFARSDSAPNESTGTENDAQTGTRGTAVLTVVVTAPTQENAGQWATTLQDEIAAEHGGEMGLHMTISPAPAGQPKEQ